MDIASKEQKPNVDAGEDVPGVLGDAVCPEAASGDSSVPDVASDEDRPEVSAEEVE